MAVKARCATRTSRGPQARKACRVKTRPAKAPVHAATPVPPVPAPAPVAVVQNCQNTELIPQGANLSLVREAVLCLINNERAADGEAALIANPELEAAAEAHAQELVSEDYFAHISPAGETPTDRIRGTGYIPSASDGYLIGENLAWGTLSLATPRAIVAAWIASPEHRANILEARYLETGVGVTDAVPSSVGEGAPGATYAQEFGTIIP